MDRIKVTEADDTGAPARIGWFDRDTAESFDEGTRWNGQNHVSLHTSDKFDHQILYRTAEGRWVLRGWSQRDGRPDTYEWIGDDRARDWLILSGNDEAAERHLGDIEPERGPGRPAIGPPITVRFPADVLEVLDATAKAEDITRAEFIRRRMARSLGVPVEA